MNDVRLPDDGSGCGEGSRTLKWSHRRRRSDDNGGPLHHGPFAANPKGMRGSRLFSILLVLWLLSSVQAWEMPIPPTRLQHAWVSSTSATPPPSRRFFFRCMTYIPLTIAAVTMTTPTVPSWATDANSNVPRSVQTTDHEEGRNDSNNVAANNSVSPRRQRSFSTAAFGKKEYTNSIIASRDTNISPLEVYETLQLQLGKNRKTEEEEEDPTATTTKRLDDDTARRALDVGAGAGVSTQVLYDQLGYTTIDAVDWSGTAWYDNVVEHGYCPPTVTFYELDDERFVKQWYESGLGRYDVIAFNFAINRDKALFFCKNLLKEDGVLLAPINTQQDYWLKQTYQLLDGEGRTIYSTNDVGAWSVQFQPDVTQPTCQGVWCSPFNGFQRLRR